MSDYDDEEAKTVLAHIRGLQQAEQHPTEQKIVLPTRSDPRITSPKRNDRSSTINNIRTNTNTNVPPSTNQLPESSTLDEEEGEHKEEVSAHPYFTNHPRVKKPSRKLKPRATPNRQPTAPSPPHSQPPSQPTTLPPNNNNSTVGQVFVGSDLVVGASFDPASHSHRIHSSDDGSIFEFCNTSISSLTQVKTLIVSKTFGTVQIAQESLQKAFSSVKLLNLHQNVINKMENLSDFVNIQELNLSSNNIEKIEGLGSLSNLKVLNLASNKISKVEGLGDLKQLRKIILAYNNITSIQGLHFLHGPNYSIKHLDLRGNNIDNLNELTYLFGLNFIREIHFQNGLDGSLGNPVCKNERYRPIILGKLALRERSSNLEILDGFKISIVRDQTRPNSRQIILNYYKDSEDDEIDTDTLTSPYIGKYLKYLNDNDSDNPNPNIVMNTSPIPKIIKNEVKVVIPTAIIEEEDVENFSSVNEEQDVISNPGVELSNGDSIETISQFIGLKKKNEISNPSSPNIVRVHIRDENTQTDISSSIFDQMLRFRSINLFDAGIQTEQEETYNDSYSTSDSSSSDKETIIQLRKNIEELCVEIGSSNVYIQNREQDLATENAKRRKLEEEMNEVKNQNTKIKKKLLEMHNQTNQLVQENTLLKEHDSQLQKEVERTKKDAYSLQESKEKEMLSMKKEYDAIIIALKKKIDNLSKNNIEAMSIIKKTKEEHSNSNESLKERFEQMKRDHERKMTQLLEKSDFDKKQLMEIHESQITALSTSHNNEISQLQKNHNLVCNEMETRMKEFIQKTSDLKNTLSDYVKNSNNLEMQSEELKNLVQMQKEKLSDLLKSKQEAVSKIFKQYEEKKMEMSNKEKNYLKELDRVSSIALDCKSQSDNLKFQLDETIKIKTETTFRLESLQADFNKLHMEMNSLKNEMNEKDNSIRQEYEKKIQNIRDEFKRDQEASLLVKNAMLNDNNETIKKQKEENGKLKDRIAFLEKELEREIREKEGFFKDEERRDIEVEKLESRIEECIDIAQKEKKKRQLCRDELNERMNELDTFKDKYTQMQNDYYELKEQLGHALKNLESEKQHNKELTVQLSRAENEIENVAKLTKKRLVVTETVNQELVVRLKSTEEKRKKYAELVLELRETNVKLEREKKVLEDLKKESEEKLNRLKANLKDL